ncbi:hypothetical protein SLEP1_g59546 [Rubroshorea leprosula]|uniref:Uncharacterized protein n=1 Tax=Rubroshorea leprosula TaxID=152421 RepID=A0AAV5MW92_9ROSI|nr:hypothetical protein SLEP1_g59546 [Rubroshorea leprosula]
MRLAVGQWKIFGDWRLVIILRKMGKATLADRCPFNWVYSLPNVQ